MAMLRYSLISMVCALAVLIGGYFMPRLAAQQQEKKEEGAATTTSSQNPAMAYPAFANEPDTDRALAIRSEMPFRTLIVKGAPFSAEAVLESARVLTDGTRVVSKSSTNLYRDSQGRTRYEESEVATGRPAENREASGSIMISDPVNNQGYRLQPSLRTATKISANGWVRIQIGNFPPRPRPRDIIQDFIVTETSPSEGPSAVPQTPRRAPMTPRPKAASAEVQTRQESLGRRTIEGVEAEGIRLTKIIPAGTVGNDRPLEIIHEEWYSPVLRVIILAQETDPRGSEATYKLTRLNRSEPNASLFQVPSDYTIQVP